MQRNRGKARLDSALSYSWMRPGSPVCVCARARVCFLSVSVCVFVCCSSAMAFPFFQRLCITPGYTIPTVPISPALPFTRAHWPQHLGFGSALGWEGVAANYWESYRKARWGTGTKQPVSWVGLASFPSPPARPVRCCRWGPEGLLVPRNWAAALGLPLAVAFNSAASRERVCSALCR